MFSRYSTILYYTLIASLLVLAGCQTPPVVSSENEHFHKTQNWGDRVLGKNCKTDSTVNSRQWNRCTVEVARTSFHYAQMVDVVYYGDEPMCDSTSTDELRIDCAYHEPRSEDEILNDHGRYNDRKFEISDRFKHLERKNKRSGLVYDVYQDSHAQRDESHALGACAEPEVCEVVIAFRGTNFDRMEDWIHGNLGERQRYQALAAYDHIAQRYPNAEIIVAGHSLGGAIAMQVSSCREVRAAFAFDGSPRFRHHLCDRNIYRNNNFQIVEQGEILRYLRFAQILGDGNPQAWISVNCRRRGSPLANHSMVELASCLTVIAAEPHIQADKSERQRALRNAAQKSIIDSDLCRDLDGIYNYNLGSFHNGTPKGKCLTGGT